jgi:hypothetical protein
MGALPVAFRWNWAGSGSRDWQSHLQSLLLFCIEPRGEMGHSMKPKQKSADYLGDTKKPLTTP